MLRFIALSWPGSQTLSCALAQQLRLRIAESNVPWRIGLDEDGFVVFYSNSEADCTTAHHFGAHQGLIFGRWFSRGSDRAPAQISHWESQEIVRSRGRYLINHYWGAYVAFIRDPATHEGWVLRDPTGAIRVFVTTVKGVHVICSNVEDFVRIGIRFTTDWAYVAAELNSTAVMAWSRTGLSEISALEGGHCLHIHADCSRIIRYWDPLEFASQPVFDPELCVDRIRTEVRRCVSAWANCHKHVVLMLSGGLDSSVVLSCLHGMKQPPRITAANFYYPGPAGDERQYARLCADRTSCELVEFQRRRDVELKDLLLMPLSARPSSSNTDQLYFGYELNRFAVERGATAVFLGQMGDQLFGRRAGMFAAVDYFWMHGLTADLASVARDVATLREVAAYHVVLEVMRVAMRRFIRGASQCKRMVYNEMHRDNPFLNSAAIRDLKCNFGGDWFASEHSISVGKMDQIGSIVAAQAYFLPPAIENMPEWIMPLNSQPLIELCLQIPFYMHVRGGWDRSLLRRAFVGHVPTEIISRQTKGSRVAHSRDILTRNRSFIRDFLLEGVLAGEGLLNRRAIADALSSADVYDNRQVFERCVWTEAWLRVWRRNLACAGALLPGAPRGSQCARNAA